MTSFASAARRVASFAPPAARRPIKQLARRAGLLAPDPVGSRPRPTPEPGVLTPPAGNRTHPALSGVVLCPMARYHTEELIPLAHALGRAGHEASFLVHPRDAADIADEMKDAGFPLYEWPADLTTLPDFDAVVVMNDWGYTKELVELAADRSRPSFAKVEGVQDFGDDDTGRWRHAYLRAEHVLCQGPNDVAALPGSTTHVVGSTRLERIRLADERSFSGRPLVVVNSNFTYGVLTDERTEWLGSVAEATSAAGVDVVVSQHHADRALAADLPIANEPMKTLLATTAHVLVSRFSTVPFEAMARGVPFVYHNPHHELVPAFTDPNGAFDVTESAGELASAITAALGLRGTYRSHSDDFFRRQIDIDPDRSSEDRAADVIADCIARSRAIHAPLEHRA